MRVFDSRKSLAFGVLLLASTLMAHAVVSKGTATVQDVAMTSNGDSVEARITTTGPARFTYFELTGPRRLVVDFHDLLNGVGFSEKQVSAAGVERVRAAIFHSSDRDATRIVFDLTNDAQYRVFDDKSNSVRVVFGKPGDVEPAPGPLRVAPPAIPAKQAPAGLVAEVQVPSNLSLQPIISPLTTQEPKSVPAFARLSLQSVTLTAQDVRSPQAVPGLMLASASPAGAAGQSQINVAPPSTPGSSLSTPAQSVQYTGEIVTFDVRDLELKDFFRLISETSGLNIILDPNVSGTLPMLRLTDVPWDKALDIVLKQNQLSGQLEGNVLRVATNGTIQAEEAARKAQLDAKDAISPLETHTYQLNYTKADVVATTLNTSLTKRGEIVRDLRKNALIITDIPTQFAKVDQMIKFLDTPAQQVEIEGRLLSANKSFSRDLGTQLGLLVGNRNIVTGGAGPGSDIDGTGRAALPLVTNLANGAVNSGVAFLLQPGSDFFLDAILKAAESNGKAKLLSAPRITTQNNQPASISQGTQIPVQTNVNNTVSVSFINFSLNLTVTPQITSAGTILLTVVLENSVPDFAKSVQGVPSVATQKAQTQVLIPDGGTAVIGGIYVDIDTSNVSQVPGLGSLPVIGHLFKSTTTIKSTSELIFFVTPKIKSLEQIVATVPDVRAEPQK